MDAMIRIPISDDDAATRGNIGNLVLSLREENGYLAKQLTSVTIPHLCRIERGRVYPRLDTFLRLLDELGASLWIHTDD
jgi:transcriptional regulator with XRE-family HTH domain